MNLQVRFFASLREALGAQQSVEAPVGTTLGALRDSLIQHSPRHAEVLSRTRSVRCAVNQVMCDETRVLADGAEVAFFPPVTGG